jgi:splicing factor 3B subunit 4
MSSTSIAAAVSSGVRNQFKQRNQSATVWIGNLDDNVTEEILWELMLQAGPVVDVNMPADKITGQHQNYAFCEFKSELDAEYAMRIMNSVKLFGKPLRINRASREKESLDIGANLFVGNLDRDVDDQLLFSTFSAFGHVLEAKVMRDDSSNVRGFGFVNFSSFEASDAAIEAMNGQYLNNKQLVVSYAFKKDGSKGDRHGSQAERSLASSKASGTGPIKMHTYFSAGSQEVTGGAPLVSSQPNPMLPASQPMPGITPGQAYDPFAGWDANMLAQYYAAMGYSS